MVLDPRDNDRFWVGMSAVGVFGTSDGGDSWQAMNQGVRADFSPTRSPNSVNVLTSSFPQNLGRMSSINRTIVVFSAATRQAKTGQI